MCCSCGKPLPSRHHLTWNCPDWPVPEDQTPCNHQASLGVSYAKLEQPWAGIRLKRLSFVGCTRFDQCYPSISSLGLSYPVLLYTLACQSRWCSAMFCTWLVERSVFSLSSFHVTFRSLPWFQNLSWSPPGQKFRQFMASVEVSG